MPVTLADGTIELDGLVYGVQYYGNGYRVRYWDVESLTLKCKDYSFSDRITADYRVGSYRSALAYINAVHWFLACLADIRANSVRKMYLSAGSMVEVTDELDDDFGRELKVRGIQFKADAKHIHCMDKFKNSYYFREDQLKNLDDRYRDKSKQKFFRFLIQMAEESPVGEVRADSVMALLDWLADTASTRELEELSLPSDFVQHLSAWNNAGQPNNVWVA